MRFESFTFPEEGWNDFPVVVLRWWIEAVRRILDGGSESEELDFMDGPFVLVVDRSGERDLLVRCRVDQGGRRIEHQALVSAAKIQEQLLLVGEELAQACEGRGWLGNDLATLQAALREMRA